MWGGFDVLDEHIFPHIQRCRTADKEILAADRAVAADEEGALAHLEAAMNEHQLAVALRKSAVKFYLDIDE